MRKRSNINQPKIIIPLVTVGCALMCVSVGFASWIVTSGSNALALGQIQADDIETGGTGENVDVITITNIDSYQYAQGYGFVNDGVYANNINLTGTCSFDATNAKSCFDSFSGSTKSFKLDVELKASDSFGGLSTKGFSSTAMELTSSNFASSEHSAITNADSITTTFTIVCNDNSENFTFDFSITLSFANALTSFPDMGNANLNVTFLPKENA